MRQREHEEWGGEPIAALADIYCARELARYDRALAESIAALEVDQLRALSVYCAERAYKYAGLADRPWVRPALAALRSGARASPSTPCSTRAWPIRSRARSRR
ncbi:hypothetical protein [Nocardia canadensis]|uniref:hypothetical protein n=1 Tax=Nocardia canadensis TaxID=3065238 RepID=UPI002931F071|nr:hypothetical protein [Nocardia canadensis]